MLRKFAHVALAAALSLGTMAASTTAEARDHYRHRGGGDDAAIAIGAGIVGLAIGAAIASDGSRNRRYYNDDYYYYDRSYPRYRGSYYYDRYPRHYRKHRRNHWRQHQRYDGYYQGDRYWRGDRNWREERRWRNHGW